MNDIIQIILIPLGITLIGAAVVEVIRRIKKDIRITCEALSLRQYNEKESGDVHISLSYKDEKVGDSLVVTTIRLTNTGKKDITFNQVFQGNIEIVLKKATIIDIVIENESDKVNTIVNKTDDNRWLLSWAMLKRKETIDLRIIAVYPNEKDRISINGIAKDLSFVFRGNSIDKIEFTAPFSIRALRQAILITSAIIISLIFIIPTDVKVNYDVKANGVWHHNVTVSYNDYTHEYILKGKKVPITRTLQIDEISVPKQPKIARDVISVGIVLLAYLFIIIVFFFIMKLSSRRNSLLRSFMSSFLFFAPRKSRSLD